MRRAAALTATDAAALYARCLPSSAASATDGVAIGLRAGCASGAVLAALLSAAGAKVLAVVGPPSELASASGARSAAEVESMKLRTVRALERHNVEWVSIDRGGDGWTANDVNRAYAKEAVLRGMQRLALPTTMVDAAAGSLIRIDGTVQAYDTEVPGAEMLPPGVLDVVRPLVAVQPATLDATVETMLGDEWTAAHIHRVPEARREVDEIGVNVESVIRYGKRRHATMVDLKRESDALLRACVVDVSHWGYAVICRESLAAVYNDTYYGGRALAMSALARLATHVSGNKRPVDLNNKVLELVAHELLRTSRDSRARFPSLLPAPKGRTVAGAVIRPANAAYAKRWGGQFRRRRGGRYHEDRGSAGARVAGRDLLILSREPDLEASRMLSRRMSGNISSVPVPDNGEGVYWDNRFVLAAGSATQIRQDQPMVSDQSVLLAALSPPSALNPEAWKASSFYVRQMRHSDWETVTTVSKRVRWHNVPYQCVRGLPAIFQKQAGDKSLGLLAAAPHLGLSGRPDMVFTAVRMPRYRCLPSELDPGFTILADVEAAAELGNPTAA